MAELKRNCELCNGEGMIYCPSDSAFLCCNCDAKVHQANFLVARHVRSSICPRCRNIAGNHFSGAGISSSARPVCHLCSPEDAGDLDSLSSSSSSSSSCVSSTTEPKRRGKAWIRERVAGGVCAAAGGGGVARGDVKVEGVLLNWCRRLGVEEHKVVPTAVELLGRCLGGMTVLPFRVSLAAAFRLALRVCSGATCQDMKRLEQISGVPGKLILATESRMARVIKRSRTREDHQEGWAEC